VWHSNNHQFINARAETPKISWYLSKAAFQVDRVVLGSVQHYHPLLNQNHSKRAALLTHKERKATNK
jgi:hypothetical protein